MTIRRRLLLSNIMMFIVPVLTAIIVAFLCLLIIVMVLRHGTSYGIDNEGSFYFASQTAVELIESHIDTMDPSDIATLKSLLDATHMRMEVYKGKDLVFEYGVDGENYENLVYAALLLNSHGTVVASGFNRAFRTEETFKGTDYTIIIVGTESEGMALNLRIAIVSAITALVFSIIFSVYLTDRILIKYTIRRIEEPLSAIGEGADKLGKGDLGYRIEYSYNDEFLPVCNAFNEMAEHLKAYSDLTKRNEEGRKELIAGLSHDIRSPLTSIKAYVEGLLDHVATTPEKEKEYLLVIERKVEEMDRMLQQMLLFSKLEMENYPVSLKKADIVGSLRKILDECKDEYKEKELTIIFSPEVAFFECPIDYELLNRVVHNILDNSVKYKIKKECTETIKVKIDDGRKCVVSFTDDGPGVPPSSLDMLFDVFYRADVSRQNTANGSGLGLSIVAKSIERMGGKVKAYNALPSGLSIVFEFEEMNDEKDSYN